MDDALSGQQAFGEGVMRSFGYLAAAWLVAGCNGDIPPGTKNRASPGAPRSPGPASAPSAPPPRSTPASVVAARSVEKTADYDFSYTIPKAAAAYPALVEWLSADRDRRRAGVARDAAAFRRESAAGGFPFRKYESTTEWKRVAQTPRFLSLSADTYDYIGGAHGSPGFRSLVWDRRQNGPLDPTAAFASEAAIQAAIGDAFCDALDIQRGKRRGTPVVRGADPFSNCPRVSEATLILGSTDGRAIDRIGLLVGPYVAGAFAEGRYDVTLPVTPALLRAVKPGYREAFAARG